MNTRIHLNIFLYKQEEHQCFSFQIICEEKVLKLIFWCLY